MDRVRLGSLWSLAVSLALVSVLMSVSSMAQAASLTVSCVAPTNYVPVAPATVGDPIPAGTTITFNLYSAPQGSPLALVTPTPISACSSVRTGLNPGVTQCYAATAIVAGVESPQTNPVCTKVPNLAPAAPTGLTVVVQVLSSDNSAYKMRQGILADGTSFYTMVAFGTVPVGTLCDATHSVDGYSLIPRSFVKAASAVDTLPLLAFAHCG